MRSERLFVLSSTLKGAQLSFRADTIDIPLGRLADHALSASGSGSISAPQITAPNVGGDDLELLPIRELAVQEILRHAASGDLLVRVPLALNDLKVGPITIEITQGTVIEIEALVRDAALVRDRTVARFVPPLKLPLGIEVREVTIDDQGNLLLDVSGLPNLNLTRLGFAPRIPTALDELLDVAMGQDSDDQGPSSEESAKEKAASQFDAKGITVIARDVRPREEELSLGRAGTIKVGSDSTIDVDFSYDRIAISGSIVILDAELHGESFRMQSIRGRADLNVLLEALEGAPEGRKITVKAKCMGTHLERAEIVLEDQSRAVIGECSMGHAVISFEQHGGAMNYSAEIKQASGTIEDSEMALKVGKSVCPIVATGRIDGDLTLASRFIDLDLNLHDVALRASELSLDLGILDVVLSPLNAQASGHIKAATDAGVSFSGDLDLDAVVQKGHVRIEEMRAALAPRSKTKLKISHIGAGAAGLDHLEASGVLHLMLKSGSIPLGPKALLSFSEGATGTVVLEEVVVDPKYRYPKVSGTGHMVAESDAVIIDPLVELPPGRASLDGNFDVDPAEGHLVISDLNMRLLTKETTST